MEPAATALLRRAAKRFALSARAVHRLRKVALTIADLTEADVIATAHVAEALGYRGLEGGP